MSKRRVGAPAPTLVWVGTETYPEGILDSTYVPIRRSFSEPFQGRGLASTQVPG